VLYSKCKLSKNNKEIYS